MRFVAMCGEFPREETGMLRRVLGMGLVLGLSVVWGEPALAGGWWTYIDLDREPVGVGETVTAETEVMFKTLEGAEAAKDEDFHAYLVRGVDQAMLDAATRQAEPGDWWTPPADRTLLGDVHLSRWNGNLALATAEFVVPDVAPGTYGLMLCDAGCEDALADVGPRLDIEILPDPFTAQVIRTTRVQQEAAQLAAELEERLERVESRTYPLRVDLARTRNDAARSASEVGDLSDAMRDLEERVEVLAAARDGGDRSAAGWFAAGVVAALAFGAAVRRRRALALIAEAEAVAAEHVGDAAAEDGLVAEPVKVP
ncbi:MAG: hypothetical protein ACRDUY_15490 [Nitriliruptorales bacterium]